MSNTTKANYTHWKLTRYGQQRMLDLKREIRISGLWTGSGYTESTNYETASVLVSPKNKYDIINIVDTTDTTNNVPIKELEFLLTNYNLNDESIVAEAYEVNELGLYVLDGDSEVLFAYQHIAPDGIPERLRPFNATDMDTAIRIRYKVMLAITKQHKITVVYGGKTTYLTADTANSLYVSKEDFNTFLHGDLAGNTENSYEDFRDEYVKKELNKRVTDNTTAIADMVRTYNKDKGLLDTKLDDIDKLNTTQQREIEANETKLTEHTNAINTLTDKVDKKANVSDIYPDIYNNDHLDSIDNLGYESMVYTFRTLKGIVNELKEVVRKTDIKIMSKDMYNDLMGLSKSKRNRLRVEIYKGNVNGIINSGILKTIDDLNVDKLYDGFDLEHVRDLGLPYSANLANGLGYVVTANFYAKVSGDENPILNEYTTSWTQRTADKDAYIKLAHRLYVYLTSPFRNGEAPINKVKKMILVFSRVLPYSQLPEETAPKIDDEKTLYLNLPIYVSTNKPDATTVYDSYFMADNYSYVHLAHLMARFTRVFNGRTTTIDTTTKNTIVTNLTTVKTEDKKLLMAVLGSVRFMCRCVDNTTGTTLEEFKNNLATYIHTTYNNLYYTKGYKVPKLDSVKTFVNYIFDNRCITPIEYDGKTSYKLNQTKYIKLGAHNEYSTNYRTLKTDYNGDLVPKIYGIFDGYAEDTDTNDLLISLARDVVDYSSINRGV